MERIRPPDSQDRHWTRYKSILMIFRDILIFDDGTVQECEPGMTGRLVSALRQAENEKNN